MDSTSNNISNIHEHIIKSNFQIKASLSIHSKIKQKIGAQHASKQKINYSGKIKGNHN